MSNTRRKRDRSRVAGGEVYEVSYFARKHGISRAQAERIISRARGSRQRATALSHAMLGAHGRRRGARSFREAAVTPARFR
jgi:Protein of unknown function (DUF3606)